MSITYDESNVHNEIIIESNDPDLFDSSDPYGSPTIDVSVGTRSMSFLLETREGERSDFSLTGISLSVLEDVPYAEDMDFLLEDNLAEGENAMKASEVATLLATNCTVEWSAFDWMVPKSFSFSGKPLDGIQQLASEIGAIVRCKDDGNLIVRRKNSTASATVDYSRSSLISLSHSEKKETGYNAVRVFGPLSDAFTPQMELEQIEEIDGTTRSPYVGESCYVRVYWEGKATDITIDGTYVTAGTIESCEFATETLTEVVDFQNGAGSVSKPIYELLSYTWIGAAADGITYDQHTSDLFLTVENEENESDLFRAAMVKYKTRFQRFFLDEHEVERLIAVLFLTTASEINVSVRSSGIAVYGPPIEASLLTSEAALVERGKAWLFDQHRRSICEISAPYDDNAIDGNAAYINDAEIGETGEYRIVSSTIQVDGPKVTNRLGIEKCLTSFVN